MYRVVKIPTIYTPICIYLHITENQSKVSEITHTVYFIWIQDKTGRTDVKYASSYRVPKLPVLYSVPRMRPFAKYVTVRYECTKEIISLIVIYRTLL